MKALMTTSASLDMHELGVQVTHLWTTVLRDWQSPLLRTFDFGQPQWFWLLALLPLLWWSYRRKGSAAAVKYSAISLFKGLGRTNRSRWHWLPRVLRTAALVLIVIALCQPRIEKDRDEQKTEGIDIMLVLDASRSMDNEDFDFLGETISRREALQRVMEGFIKDRVRDRLGIIAFAEKPFLVSPLTLDHSWMMESLKEVRTSMGTAIGSAVEASVDLLSKSGSAVGNKVVIVVTDGLNTTGLDPLYSAKLAEQAGVRLYTIGVVGYEDMKTGGVDKVTLNQMARLTGGQFFQAADGVSLQSIYRQIDQLERREFKQSKLRAYRQLFASFVLVALVLLLIELLLKQGRRLAVP